MTNKGRRRVTQREINDVYFAVQEALGVDWPQGNRGMNSSLINYLLGRGYKAEDIVGCAGYLRHEPKAAEYDMRRVRNALRGWIRNRRPSKPPKRGEVVQLGRADDYEPPGTKMHGVV